MSGDASEYVERYIRQTFGLDSAGLQRVGLFLLAHVLVDTHLIARALVKAVRDRSGGAGITLLEIQALADEISADTFGRHLERVRSGLPGDAAEIAQVLNQARNALLHWKRKSLPAYKGQDVTTDAGLRACMDDVLRFIQTVPFEMPIGGGPHA